MSAGLRELEQFGYLERKMVRQSGKFSYENIIRERPELPDVKPISPGRKNRSGKTVPEKPLQKTRPIVNNNKIKYKVNDQQRHHLPISDQPPVLDRVANKHDDDDDARNQLNQKKPCDAKQG